MNFVGHNHNDMDWTIWYSSTFTHMQIQICLHLFFFNLYSFKLYLKQINVYF